MSWANFIAGLAHQYPDAAALIIASLLSWAPAVVLEYFFLPETWTDRKMKQVSLIITISVAFVLGDLLWHQMDPADTKGFVGLVSFGAAFSAPFVHILMAALLTKFFPKIDSVFKFKPKAA